MVIGQTFPIRHLRNWMVFHVVVFLLYVGHGITKWLNVFEKLYLLRVMYGDSFVYTFAKWELEKLTLINSVIL